MLFEQGNELREFNCLYKELDDAYHEVALKAGLSDSSFIILYGIVELGDGCLQIDIARKYSISKQTISSSVRQMEKRGLIVLKKGKGRDMRLFLTSDGQKIIEEKIIPVMEVENSVFSAMTPEYVTIFKEKIREMKERKV